MNDFLELVKKLKSVDDAIELLARQIELSDRIRDALDFAIAAHEGQTRKSGEPYVIHPILVAAITASISNDETMVISALLHDVVEDTPHSIEEIGERFGHDVRHIVEGLTKIVEIRDEKLVPSDSKEKLITSALTFRKMLIASIEDVRVLIIKLCDRLHNMLTLDALPPAKQLRISEETLVVYAPIAHRLGISRIKNLLEDLSFRYIYPEDYRTIDEYIKANHQSLHIRLNSFIGKVKNTLCMYGFHRDDFEVIGRVKHYYSIYLKMHRKGIGIDEVLDLLAVRVIVKQPIECYKALGALHLEFTPLISRFKDYIALPKDNGYQTIHTTLFDDENIVEAQIRTERMHHLAEYGIAAHWKYKEGGESGDQEVKLEWLKSLPYQDDSIEEFYELAKNDLYSEDIVVFSPKGDYFTLPKDSVALDFAYAVHSEIGDRATAAIINKERASLLTILKNGDIVRIVTQEEPILHCSWVDTVKTSKAKEGIRSKCRARIREVNEMAGFNILATLFDRSVGEIRRILEEADALNGIDRVPTQLDVLREKIHRISKAAKIREVRKWEVFRRGYKKPFLKEVDHLSFYVNKPLERVEFDFCCHPKVGDDIVAFYKENRAIIHHKLCRKAYEQIKAGEPMLFVQWRGSNLGRYRLIVALQNQKGVLAKLLTKLSQIGLNIISIELGIHRSDSAEYCQIEVESEGPDKKEIAQVISRQFRLVEITALNDAYNHK
ncbi:RelA/SpoT family protein [Nitratifractor salsuginis]|uniref:(P)ppGpp synthetase I, SpoT/RelA n=1 Tax=Nitratifractor salsuginis (strain DSM 16511 / JCM 12458 / E9I37-1) TaxID=749222 RepID=E6X2Q6_NITSE|nr:RelA/SpoT family protein [Nitratifractor salsuginis]ADV46122.1 (p)ppGpp synthetase I, SpoT/RelA [Nitratifractor salsuginis DSM 16511]